MSLEYSRKNQCIQNLVTKCGNLGEKIAVLRTHAFFFFVIMPSYYFAATSLQDCFQIYNNWWFVSDAVL